MSYDGDRAWCRSRTLAPCSPRDRPDPRSGVCGQRAAQHRAYDTARLSGAVIGDNIALDRSGSSHFLQWDSPFCDRGLPCWLMCNRDASAASTGPEATARSLARRPTQRGRRRVNNGSRHRPRSELRALHRAHGIKRPGSTPGSSRARRADRDDEASCRHHTKPVGLQKGDSHELILQPPAHPGTPRLRLPGEAADHAAPVAGFAGATLAAGLAPAGTNAYAASERGFKPRRRRWRRPRPPHLPAGFTRTFPVHPRR